MVRDGRREAARATAVRVRCRQRAQSGEGSILLYGVAQGGEAAHSKHVAHVRDAGGIPAGDVGVEVAQIDEEVAHVGHARHVPAAVMGPYFAMASAASESKSVTAVSRSALLVNTCGGGEGGGCGRGGAGGVGGGGGLIQTLAPLCCVRIDV